MKMLHVLALNSQPLTLVPCTNQLIRDTMLLLYGLKNIFGYRFESYKFQDH